MSVLLEVTPLALALVVAASPVLLVPVTLVSKRSVGIGLLFLLGWVCGVLLVSGAVVLFGDLAEPGRRTPDWWGWVLLLLGAVLVVLGARKWRRRVGAGEPEAPAWMGRIEGMSGAATCGLGLVLVVVNPKNLALAAAGGAVVVEATAQPAQQVGAILWFTLVGSLGVAFPVLIPVLLGRRAQPVLDAVDRWLTRHSGTIVALVLLVLGVLLVARGWTDLVGASMP